MYDLIGDIHGHASELVKLLAALGYPSTPDGKLSFWATSSTEAATSEKPLRSSGP